MKVMCILCGKVSELMSATTVATDEEGKLKTYHFCSQEHLSEYARKKGLNLEDK